MKSEDKLAEVLSEFIDLEDDSTKDTPKRIIKMYRNEIFSSINEPFPKITTFEAMSDAMVVECKIRVRSTCEHHFQPIWGYAHVGYIPSKKIIGLSKLNRIVDYYSRRPQVQERLTKNISEALIDCLGTADVAVMVDAEHYCVKMRGIKDDNALTRTTLLSGLFKHDKTVREEFLSCIRPL